MTAPGRVKGRSQAGRFADLVALARFTLEKQPVPAQVADSVPERFNEWLMDKVKAGTTFTPKQNHASDSAKRINCLEMS